MNIGKVPHPCLADFSEKRITYGRGPKTKKLSRQGKAKSRQGKVGLNRLHDAIYPCLSKTKISSLPLFILASRIFSVV